MKNPLLIAAIGLLASGCGGGNGQDQSPINGRMAMLVWDASSPQMTVGRLEVDVLSSGAINRTESVEGNFAHGPSGGLIDCQHPGRLSYGRLSRTELRLEIELVPGVGQTLCDATKVVIASTSPFRPQRLNGGGFSARAEIFSASGKTIQESWRVEFMPL